MDSFHLFPHLSMQKALKCEILLFSHLRAYNFYFIISFMILIIVNIFYTSFLDDFSPSFAIAVYIRHIHHPGECIWKLPGTAVFIYVFSSFIQTIRSVLELHQIMRHALADFTAGRELHPALKNILFPSVLYRIMLYYSTVFYTFSTMRYVQKFQSNLK